MGDDALRDPKPDRTSVYKNIGEVELELHIFTPPNHQAGDRKPAIVFFFGGGWVRGTPRQFYPQSEYLASRGMVAISADYRVQQRHGQISDPEGVAAESAPQTAVGDGKSAIRWIRNHAGELGIDPERLAAGGGSAGGQVATAAATVAGFNEEGEDTSVSCRPEALVLFNPVFDNGPEGYGFDRTKAYWKTFSPVHNIDANVPPSVVFFGTEDTYAPAAEKYKKRVEDVGGRCDLHLYEEQGHGFFNRAKFYETLLESDRFLASLGYLEGPPTLEKR